MMTFHIFRRSHSRKMPHRDFVNVREVERTPLMETLQREVLVRLAKADARALTIGRSVEGLERALIITPLFSLVTAKTFTEIQCVEGKASERGVY